MNKKIISILIILSLLLVSLTSISANETSIDEQNIADITPTEEDTIINEETESTEDNTTNEDTNKEVSKDYPDIVVPTNVEELEQFNILMNFITPEGLDAYADHLEEIDPTTYKDVITALRENDRENLIIKVGVLTQDKIDVFFDEFLKFFDITSETTQNQQSNNPINIISNTISQITGSSNNQNTVPTNSYIKSNQQNSYINLNPTNNNGPSQNNLMYEYKGQYYSMIDFVKLISDLYRKGEINSTEFIQVLEDNDIDTTDITVEEGIIHWGYLHIIPDNQEIIDDTNAPIINETDDTEIVTEDTSEANNTEAVEETA